MADIINSISTWFLSLGKTYGVNPIIFGSIYVGSIPLFTLSLAWFIKNMKAKKPIVLPAFITAFLFVSAYLYLIIAGKNVPLWVYLFISVMILSGIYTTWRKVQLSLKSGLENE